MASERRLAHAPQCTPRWKIAPEKGPGLSRIFLSLFLRLSDLSVGTGKPYSARADREFSAQGILSDVISKRLPKWLTNECVDGSVAI